MSQESPLFAARRSGTPVARWLVADPATELPVARKLPSSCWCLGSSLSYDQL